MRSLPARHRRRKGCYQQQSTPSWGSLKLLVGCWDARAPQQALLARPGNCFSLASLHREKSAGFQSHPLKGPQENQPGCAATVSGRSVPGRQPGSSCPQGLSGGRLELPAGAKHPRARGCFGQVGTSKRAAARSQSYPETHGQLSWFPEQDVFLAHLGEAGVCWLRSVTSSKVSGTHCSHTPVCHSGKSRKEVVQEENGGTSSKLMKVSIPLVLWLQNILQR